MKQKTFDCVRMKWEIQQKQREAFAGVSDDDRRRILAERAATDPILGPFLKRVSQRPPLSPRPQTG
jgi:hypothetical protein